MEINKSQDILVSIKRKRELDTFCRYTEDEFKNKIHKFVDKYYPLSTCLPPFSITDLNREIWYCNVSGIYLPELQDVYGCIDEIPINNNRSSDIDMKWIDAELYNEGYKHYRIYPCGHVFLDVYLLVDIYNNLMHSWYSKWDIERVDKILKDSETNCLFCKGKTILSRKNMYECASILSIDTGILNKLIPSKYLPYIKSIFEKGDVVDCSGYRGTGLYLFNGNEFKKVRTGWDYPIWPLEYLELKGYMHYFKLSEGCDAIIFRNNILYIPSSSTFIPLCNINCDLYDIDYEYSSDEKDDRDFWREIDNICNEFNISTYEFSEDDESMIENGSLLNLNNYNNVISYPFENVFLLNMYLRSRGKYKIKLNNEYLIFDEGNVYLCDINGDNTIILT